MMSNAPEIHRVHEGMRSISGPDTFICKAGDVPHQFVHDLRKFDRMSRGAGAATGGTRALSVGDMALVIGRIKILAVPAADRLLKWIKNF